MTKKDLQQLYWTKRNIQALENKLLELETEATRVTTQLSNDPKGPRKIEDKQGELVIKMIEVQEEINRQLEKAYEHKCIIERLIETLSEKEGRVIRLRYIELKNWENICVDIGCSWRKIHYIHSDILDKIK